MAASLHLQPDDLPTHDITSCNKCHQLLKRPKTLPCLHSYCTSCLEEKVTASTKSIECLVCSQEFDLPANGIEDLIPLAIVERLTEQKVTQERLMTSEPISCTACVGSISYEKTDTSSVTPDAVARCTECEDYLCTRCVAMHRSQRRMIDHPIFTLDELRTGKVLPIGSSEQKICANHKGEALLFYCDTCEVPICRHCVVVTHRHPDHKQVELKEAAKDRKDTLRQLQSDCKNNVNEVGKAIDEIGRMKREYSLAVSEARVMIRETAENAKTLFMQRLEEARKIAECELDKIDQEQQQTVKATENHLLSVKSRISAATMTSKTLIDTGSDYEVTSAYSTLQTTLNDLSNVKTGNGNFKLQKVTFEPNAQICPEIITVGRVTGGGSQPLKPRPREIKVSGTLLKEFGRSGNGLQFALDMCVTSAGDVAVTENTTGTVKVFINKDTLKFSFDVNTGVDAAGTSNPWCIRVGSNDLFYVTDWNSPYVRIFDMQGTYTRSFYTVSPENVSYSTSGSSRLCGLCFDSEDNILVGNITHNFISRHSLDGAHLSSIKVGLSPGFLAVTPKDEIVVSSYINSNDVKILDGEGNVLVNVIKPNHVASWNPAGVVAGNIYYCNDDVEEQELFIADRGNGHAVYRYTVTGKYVNSVTTAVSAIYGLALSDDEQHLYVADTTSVKCFDI